MANCSTEDCENPSRTKGLCHSHYQQHLRRVKDPTVGTPKPRAKAPTVECSIEDCANIASRKGMCQNHYRQAARKAEDPDVGTRKPGPKPDPTKKKSRYRERGRTPAPTMAKPLGRIPIATNKVCAHSHPWDGHTTAFSVGGKKYCRYCTYVSTAKRDGREPKSLEAWIKRREDRELFCPNGHSWAEDNLVVDSKTGLPMCRTCRQHNSRKSLYGISPEEYQTLLDGQGNACVICRTSFEGMSTKGIHVDHDHSCCPGGRTCGKCVRGVLCSRCNLGLGKFDDDVDRLKRAVSYLSGPSTE